MLVLSSASPILFGGCRSQFGYLDQLTRELWAAQPGLPLFSHGLNAIGEESGNGDACAGRLLPWLQDVPAQSVWSLWQVTYRDCIILDDMIDTAGTLTQAVDSLLKNGAKQVFAIATHPVFSGPAIARLKESRIEKVFVTDTIPLSAEAKESGKISVVSIAPVLAEAIKRIHDHDSVSSLFD